MIDAIWLTTDNRAAVERNDTGNVYGGFTIEDHAIVVVQNGHTAAVVVEGTADDLIGWALDALAKTLLAQYEAIGEVGSHDQWSRLARLTEIARDDNYHALREFTGR